jgi:hypothetical protein
MKDEEEEQEEQEEEEEEEEDETAKFVVNRFECEKGRRRWAEE